VLRGGINLYAYVNNDPLNLIDPFGLSPDSPQSNYGYGYGANAQRATDNLNAGNYGAAAYYELLHTADTLLAITPFGAAENAVARGASALAAEEAAPLAQVTLNRIAGNAFRDSLADSLRAAGRDVETEVYKSTPFGKRFIDIEVSKDGQVLGGIETKVGSSPYTSLQQLKDWWLKDALGYTVNVARDR
jgi:hypothetical protein